MDHANATPLQGRPSRAPSSKGKEALLLKVEAVESILRIIHDNTHASSADLNRLKWLCERLQSIKALVTHRRWRPRLPGDNSLLGEHLQNIESELLLLMPVDMLYSEALKVMEQFQRTIHEPTARETWLGPDEKSGPLFKAVEQVAGLALLTYQPPPEAQQKLRHTRHVLWGALRIVNEQAATSSRQLASMMLIRGASGVVLVMLFFLSWSLHLPPKLHSFLNAEDPFSHELGFLGLGLVGAGGAMAANLLSEVPTIMDRPSWRQLLYHLFVKPSIGVFAAFLFYVLAQSNLIFSIGSNAAGGDAQASPAIRIMLGNSPQALTYTYVLLTCVVGFSAEKLLGPLVDKVLGKLFTFTDKSPPPAPGKLPAVKPQQPQASPQPTLLEEVAS
jgi:hypothetical protein